MNIHRTDGSLGLVKMRSTIFLVLTLLLWSVSVKAAEPAKVFDLGAIRKRSAVFDIGLTRDNRVLIPDLSLDQVVILDGDLARVIKILKVITPHAAVEDPMGNLYVGTHRSGRIKKFDKRLREIPDWDRKLFDSGEIKAPVALEIGKKDTVYVCDWIMQRVIQVNGQGELLRVFEDSAIKSKAEFQAHGLSVDLNLSRVYVADRGNEGGNGAIHSFTLDGKYLLTWPRPAPDFDPFTIRALTKDLFIVPNYTDGAFYIFDPEGNLLEKYEAFGDQPGRFNHATSVIADKRGFIYVPELKGDRVQKVDFNPVIKRLKDRMSQP